MSGEIEVDESYFLQGFARNCEQKGQKECVESVGVGLVAKVFTLCYALVPLREEMLKRNGRVYYASDQTLLCKRVVAYHKGLFRA